MLDELHLRPAAGDTYAFSWVTRFYATQGPPRKQQWYNKDLVTAGSDPTLMVTFTASITRTAD